MPCTFDWLYSTARLKKSCVLQLTAFGEIWNAFISSLAKTKIYMHHSSAFLQYSSRFRLIENERNQVELGTLKRKCLVFRCTVRKHMVIAFCFWVIIEAIN